MNKKRLIVGIISIALLSQPVALTNSHATGQTYNSTTLKMGMHGQSVEDLQLKLKELGYFNHRTTGYFGSITQKAVLKLQKDYNLTADGIVGKSTHEVISGDKKNILVSRGSSRIKPIEEWTWFGKITDILPRGTVYRVTDIQTGKSFNVKRTYGTNHADSETLTKEDTLIMKEIYGDAWSWMRRPIIVEVGNYKLAASMAGMPHGADFIGDNNMKGHFDVHFLKSKTHGTNRINPDHQKAIRKAQIFLNKQLSLNSDGSQS